MTHSSSDNHDTESARRVYLKGLLRDIDALERMLQEGLLESGVRRIGAEQEVAIVDRSGGAFPIADELLKSLPDDLFTNELGRFNIEVNFNPIAMGGYALRDLEQQIHAHLGQLRAVARQHEAMILLVGILPSLSRSDLTLDNLTDKPRYHELNEVLTQLRGGPYELNIDGIDELSFTHDNIMLESCNTSFQVHFQVDPDTFARWYNIAQLASAPVLAAATNSPVLLNRRLWRETRIALFQQSIDTRIPQSSGRRIPPRVSFGSKWMTDGALEIFREDVSRFKPLFYDQPEEDSLAVLKAGGVPSLSALRRFNGTVYRWNRPCYGVCDGKPHLRIENRMLPAGPTPIDEVANTALWLGLLRELNDSVEDVTSALPFETVAQDFFSAARHGLDAQIHWLDGRIHPARELILERILPMSALGLEASGIDASDIERYLSVIEQRVRTGRTGSAWILDSISAAGPDQSSGQLYSRIAEGIAERQLYNAPVHTWKTLSADEFEGDKHHVSRVSQFMATELFTVHQDDVIDLVTNLMDWKHLRQIPVENDAHELVGLVTYRHLLKHLRRLGVEDGADESESIPVSAIMEHDVISISADARSAEAYELMRKRGISCLPVVEKGKLVGMVTDEDFIRIADGAIRDFLSP
ncbi:MAG: hypothetical protein CBC35_05155 [Planctomycetes bacterium TMED75]|nr:hypothetical protein [Planctomycetaceae bacterium]OUU93644.1 MAG: hypothetical protein CBC35_05155 [Planctomycetes bacterium TMED75]